MWFAQGEKRKDMDGLKGKEEGGKGEDRGLRSSLLPPHFLISEYVEGGKRGRESVRVVEEETLLRNTRKKKIAKL